ncbi:hypothetical protein PG985_010352 [Apiospora marii]|uniref:uncharacterized protein n=1 Tax=Apiospora marii TaxID=335849 RepID=UPI0031303E27
MSVTAPKLLILAFAIIFPFDLGMACVPYPQAADGKIRAKPLDQRYTVIQDLVFLSQARVDTGVEDEDAEELHDSPGHHIIVFQIIAVLINGDILTILAANKRLSDLALPHGAADGVSNRRPLPAPGLSSRQMSPRASAASLDFLLVLVVLQLVVELALLRSNIA